MIICTHVAESSGLNAQPLGSGSRVHSVRFDASGALLWPLACVYLYRIEAGTALTEVRRMLLVKQQACPCAKSTVSIGVPAPPKRCFSACRRSGNTHESTPNMSLVPGAGLEPARP